MWRQTRGAQREGSENYEDRAEDAAGEVFHQVRRSADELRPAFSAVTGQILFMVPGTMSIFATPAIGAAYLSGNREVMALQFSPVLTLITAVALLLTVAGNIVLGVAIWRSGVLSRWTGLLWITGTLVFYVFGAFLGMATTAPAIPFNQWAPC